MTDTCLDASQPYCYVTTVGRVTGEDHEIEIWFAGGERSLYLISGGKDRSDWVRNLLADAHARVRVGDRTTDVTARLPLGRSGGEARERSEAIDLLYDKYGEQVAADRRGWHRDAFVVALDLTRGASN